MLVKEIMNKLNTVIKLSDTIRTAINTFRQTKLNGLPLVNETGQLIGYFTRSNLYDNLLAEIGLEEKVGNCIYEKNVICFREDKNFASLIQVTEWLRTSSVSETPVVDDNDRPIGVITYLNAVTLLINLGEMLYSQLHAVVESIPIGIMSADNDGKVNICNAAAKKILRLKSSEITGENLTNIVPGNIFDEWQCCLDEKMALPKRIEYGEVNFIMSAIPIDGNNKERGVTLIIHDTSEMEKISRELNSTKQFKSILQAVLDLTYDGIALLNLEGLITFANPAFSELIGKPLNELYYQPIMTAVGEKLSCLILKETNKTEVCYIAGRLSIISILPMMTENKVQGKIIKIIHLDQLRENIVKLDNFKSQLLLNKDQLYQLNMTKYTFDSIVTQDESMLKLKSECMRIAESNSNVLILGETGTGKEVFAQAIHNASRRSRKPFIKVNCAAIPSELAESELFGYEPGAFTGAGRQGKQGKFELANGGTIFLDEIGDMPLSLQTKLLRVIQEREVESVGGTKPRLIDVRVIAATNTNLEDLVQQGKFRKDLFYRLSVIALILPPLRSRKTDISFLSDWIIQKFNFLMGLSINGLTKSALEFFEEYEWPGNIRELENCIERAMNLVPKDKQLLDRNDFITFNKEQKSSIEIPALIPDIEKSIRIDIPQDELKDALAVTEKQIIINVINRVSGNKAQAARELKISRSTLYEKLKRYNLEGV